MRPCDSASIIDLPDLPPLPNTMNVQNRVSFPEVGVIALVPDHWGPYWQARHQVATRLARYFEIVWVDNPVNWRNLFLQNDFARQPAWTGPLEPSLQIYSPGRSLPEFGRPEWLANLTSRKRLKHAHDLLLRRGCTKIVLYIWQLRFGNALNLVPHALSCYHIDDEYSFSPEEQELDLREMQIIQAVDQVFIHSPAMMEKKGYLNPHTEFVPNGVDYASYAQPAPEPEDLRSIPHPRIGYTGMLKKQLDWSLLLQLSAEHPEWSFVFVGPLSPQLKSRDVLQSILAQPNVHFLGAKSTRELAAYPQHFQVCIMPYRIDGYTKYIYPLKLHEYLASARPVVASRIPSLQRFEGTLSLATMYKEWSGAIEQALRPAADSLELRSARQSIAQSHDWDILVRQIAERILQRLGIESPEHSSNVAEPALT
jgi:glycosyltransferase involved in cell wall biosynthesis